MNAIYNTQNQASKNDILMTLKKTTIKQHT